MSRVLASTTTAEYLGADELAPKAKLQKNKIKMALMPEKNNLTGLPQTFTDLCRLKEVISCLAIPSKSIKFKIHFIMRKPNV